MLAHAAFVDFRLLALLIALASLPVIGVPVFIGLGLYARRRGRPKLERNATIGCLVCLLIVLGLMLMPAH